MEDHQIAIVAAEAGARVVRARRGSRVVLHNKGGCDFATDVDLEAEHAILDVLRRHRPADGVIAEESGPTGISDACRRWFVDPLCGTANYASGAGPVGVNVALEDADRVIAAAVADPFAGETVWTDGRTCHVRCGLVDELARPISGSRLVELNLDPPFPNSKVFRATALLTDAGFQTSFRPRVTSTSLALAWVAVGKRAAYVTDGNLHANVHFAAPIAVCRAAGCVVTDLRGDPLGGEARGLLVGADPGVHTSLLEMVAHGAKS